MKTPKVGDRVLDSMGVVGHILEIINNQNDFYASLSRKVRTSIHKIPVIIAENGDEWIIVGWEKQR